MPSTISETKRKNSGAGVSDLKSNKALYIDMFSTDLDGKEALCAPQKLQDVFDYYEPSVNVTFNDAEGTDVEETLRFHQLKDFEANGGNGNLVKNSNFLNGIKQDIDINSRILDQLRRNAKLKNILKDAGSKQELITMLQGMIDELKQANN